MDAEQAFLTRQLILSVVAEERGARCPFMVELYNVFYTDQRVSIVMELMDGGSLQDKLDDYIAERDIASSSAVSSAAISSSVNGRKTNSFTNSVVNHARHSFNALTSPRVHHPVQSSVYDLSTLRNIARQALRGLALLHRQHRMHRDIKPANILMSRNGARVKLADFGIAAEGKHSKTEFTEFVGTLLYMSPERLQGSSTYGFEADIWSFGLTIYSCVVGELPHKNLSQFDLIQTVTTENPPRLDRNIYPSDVCEFVALCLEKDPKHRPTAKQLLKHPFLKVSDKAVKEVIQRQSQNMIVGSPASKMASQNLDDIIEHLHEFYTTTRLDEESPTFAENCVRGLAQQLGAWPQTAIRKFEKLERGLKNHRLAMLRQKKGEEQHHLGNVSGDDDEKEAEDLLNMLGLSSDQQHANNGGSGRGTIVGETQWSEEVHVTLPPMSRRKPTATDRNIDNYDNREVLESSRLSLMSIDGDALDL
jgi:serine/threonine protein kinase